MPQAATKQPVEKRRDVRKRKRVGQAAAYADGDHDPAQRRRPGPCVGPGSGGQVQGEIETPGPGKTDVAPSTHVQKR